MLVGTPAFPLLIKVGTYIVDGVPGFCAKSVVVPPLFGTHHYHEGTVNWSTIEETIKGGFDVIEVEGGL
jgi:hypothetical protein